MSRQVQYSLAGAVVGAKIVTTVVMRRRRKARADAAAASIAVDRKKPGDEARRKKHGLQGVIRLVMLALAVAAVVRELRLPADQRTWHGVVAGVVPYDFRRPTMARLRAANWDPEGRLVGPRAIGVGWTVNTGRLVHLVRERVSSGK